MDRITDLEAVLTSKKATPKYVGDSLSWMGFDQLLPESSRRLIKELRPQLEDEKIYSQILEHIEKAQYPDTMLPFFKKLELGKYFYSEKYGGLASATAWDRVIIIMELGRVDASIATALMVQHVLLGKTIEMFGTEEMKKEYIPKIMNLDLIGGWGLTELTIGSDASSMTTKVKKDGDNFILSGNKRWIGNANKDIMVVFAKDESDEVGCYLLDLTWPGIRREAIKNKMALRPVQNMQLFFDDVKIPAKNKLPGVKGFNSVATLLAESRIFVAWLASGLGVGCYDYMIKYLVKREQFERPLVAFQLIQEKIFKVMSRVQASLFMNYNIQKRHLEGKASIGQIAMAKAFATEMLREAARWARESFGGNGIIADYHVMKVLVDAEVLFTYEGTYDINMLVAGRELTGVAAFKTR